MRRIALLVPLFLAACGEEASAPAPAPPTRLVAGPVPAPAPSPEPATASAPAPEERQPWEEEPDPIRRRTLKESAWLRAHPGLEGKAVRIHDLRPFLVAEVVRPGRQGPTLDTARFLRPVLLGVHDSMRAFLKEVADVDAPRIDDLGDERLRWVLLPSREEFDRWHAALGLPNPGGPYTERSGDRLGVLSMDDFEDRAVAWVASLQLLARWRLHFLRLGDDATARERGEPTVPVTPDDTRLTTSFAWFDLGLASWFAGGERTKDPRPGWRPGLPATLEYAHILKDRDAGFWWPLEEFLFADRAQIEARARSRWEGSGVERAVAAHGRQSRLLFDVLLQSESPWRTGFGRMVRCEASAISGKVYLLDSFGLPRRSDTPEVRRWLKSLEQACVDRLLAGPPASPEPRGR